MSKFIGWAIVLALLVGLAFMSGALFVPGTVKYKIGNWLVQQSGVSGLGVTGATTNFQSSLPVEDDGTWYTPPKLNH